MNGGNSWCILRTSGGKTLALANALSQAGLGIWTPRETQKRAKPNSRHAVQVEREIAILPTFVFAQARHVPFLAVARTNPVSPFPAFSIFQHDGRIPLVSDEQIAGLRAVEERLRVKSRRSKRRALVMGQRVNGWGAFTGLSGEVVKLNSNGKTALVAFGGGFEVEIEAWQIPEDVVNDRTSGLSAVA